jgi:6-phosphogluconolactonase (cycloisomerase 2 family)
VAYQFSNELRVLERDARTGALRETGQSHPVEVPACLMFA